MEYLRVGDCFDIIKGKKVEQLNEESENSIRYIQIDDLRNDNNIKYCLPDEKYVIAKKNDIIIAWDGANAGTIGYGLEGAIGSTLAILRWTLEDKVCTSYVGRFLQSKSKYLRYKCTGATIPHVSKESLENILIPVPDLQTQHKIVQVLDKAQSLIDKRKEQIKQCDELIQSLFYDMFGDPGINSKGFKVAQISDLVDHNIKKVSKVYEEEDTIKYIDISSIDNETNKITNYSIYKVKDAPSRAQQCLCKGDIIISTVRPNLKNVAMVLSEDEDLVGSSGFCVLRSNKINNQYLFRYVLSEYFTKKLTSMTTGANYPAIKKNDVLEQTILLPPLELQNQFAEKVQKIEKQKQLLQQSLSLLEDNFNSLMQKAFKGELFQ
jgi:type I restriction enzyme S subunit